MAASPISVMSTVKHSIDLKANGEVSRMRNHKGNMPSLPQTKYCSLCPAKFTRTTHLNRHLRSHTNERSHRCTTCNAEFTRSDLLTRHKRTCGDSSNANRSRRKSCQACAESKVKCNLQYPCSKCASRGRECIFINDPEMSRNKKNASKKTTQRSTSPKKSDSVSSHFGPITSSDASSSIYSMYSNTVNGLSSPTLSLSSTVSTSRTPSIPSLSHSSSSSSPSSSRASPQSDLFETRQDTFDLEFDSLSMDTPFSGIFSNNVYDSFLEEPLTCSPTGINQGNFTNWMENGEFGYDDPFALSQPFSMDQQDFVTEYAAIIPPTNLSPTILGQHAPIVATQPLTHFQTPPISSPHGPLPEELDHYLYLFFSSFCTQIPLLHHSSWQTAGKPPILVRAMQACGALFVKTRTAMNFISETLLTTRDTLLVEFAKTNSDLGEQLQLILAVVLLQTIGLFHQHPDQRVSSNIYHGLLVMMIRRTGLISRIGSWSPPNLTDINSLESAWKDWAHYETIKRALFLSYLHDCCHCMYFSLSPSFHPTEFDISLPCDDALWVAGGSREWLQTLQTSSPYGTGLTRIAGVGMQQALAILGEMRPSGITLPLNPFSHFILIHTVLRNIYASRSSAASPEGSMRSHMQRVNDGTMPDSLSDNSFAIQYALHNWLQLWMSSPEAMRLEKSNEEPPFVCNAMPFYWLAQIAVVAIQDGTSGAGFDILDGKGEGRYRVLREWLDRIRTFLRNGTQIPTHLWDELMKIRLQVSQSAFQSVDEYPNGLFSFFPDV